MIYHNPFNQDYMIFRKRALNLDWKIWEEY